MSPLGDGHSDWLRAEKVNKINNNILMKYETKNTSTFNVFTNNVKAYKLF